jgi:hypothetical protein
VINQPLNEEQLNAIFQRLHPEPSRQRFIVRLLRSIRFTVKISRKAGKIASYLGIRGGADF